ncbi:Hepatic leukemia factor [Armadillidium vulgare]|nr:Hepatic leukemia factor [Armadillidium vulgare]
MELLDLDDFLKENDIDEDLLNQSFKAETSETFKNGLFDGVPSSERTSADAGSTINGERESRQISPSLSFEGYQESETSSEASGSSYANEKKYWMSNSNQQDEFETPSKSLRKHSSKSSKDYSSCKHPNEKRSKFSSRPSSCNSIDYPPSLLGEEGFDPRTRVFSDDELKPQQMIKKSKKKQLVPSDLKDEKYWARRQKNNVAAKRSRDARRTKENQIAMRARYLEKENQNLKMELQDTLLKLETMKRRLSEYETP